VFIGCFISSEVAILKSMRDSYNSTSSAFQFWINEMYYCKIWERFLLLITPISDLPEWGEIFAVCFTVTVTVTITITVTVTVTISDSS
jgi:hypothetical protein